MTKAVIIDDEINSRELLHNMLQDLGEGIEVVGEAYDVPSGIREIQAKQPDLIFLDIEMPGGNCFDILDAFEHLFFKVIFVTGYDQYALKAIKYSALDYLLKPIDQEEFENALERVRKISGNQTPNINYLNTQKNQGYTDPDKIMLPSSNDFQLIDLQDLLSIEANGNYTFFYMSDGKKHLASQPLSYYEELLPSGQFFRIHKSYMVNCLKVVRIEDGRTGKAFLEDGSQVSIAARRKKAFVDLFRRLKNQ